MRGVLIAVGLWSMLSNVQAAGMCSIERGGIAFGNIEARPQERADSVGELSISCTGGEETLVKVALLRDDPAAERAIHGSPFVLYLDPARRRIWGDGKGHGEALLQIVPGNGQPVRIPIYGEMRGTSLMETGSLRHSMVLELSMESISLPAATPSSL